MVTCIETEVIRPTKAMPFEIFRRLWRLAYFMELMDRTPDGRVLWDDERSAEVNEELGARAEYEGMQRDYFTMTMEVPKVVIDRLRCHEVGQLELSFPSTSVGGDQP